MDTRNQAIILTVAGSFHNMTLDMPRHEMIRLSKSMSQYFKILAQNLEALNERVKDEDKDEDEDEDYISSPGSMYDDFVNGDKPELYELEDKDDEEPDEYIFD